MTPLRGMIYLVGVFFVGKSTVGGMATGLDTVSNCLEDDVLLVVVVTVVVMPGMMDASGGIDCGLHSTRTLFLNSNIWKVQCRGFSRREGSA